MKIDIYGLELQKVQELFLSVGLAKFRARQVYQWLYQKSVNNFSQMHNISKKDLQIIEDNFCLTIEKIKILDLQKSSDGLTQKMLLNLADNNTIETVLMRHDYGYSICISSQVGCNMNCAFVQVV